MTELIEELAAKLAEAEKVLVGIGEEWKLPDSKEQKNKAEHLTEAYKQLQRLLQGKDYYVVTTLTDGAVYENGLDSGRIVAPCGNVHWFQCSKACTKDIWEEGEVENHICPHCGAPLTANTIDAQPYIEEGYLPRWENYKRWQAETLNRRLLILELGEGFSTPTVMRWPFEKITFYNHKASMYRIHSTFFQVPAELGDKAKGVKADSVDVILNIGKERTR